MSVRRVVHLVQHEGSHDTKEAAKAISADAESGQLVGIAFVGIYRGGDYICDTAGEAFKNTTLTIGMVRMLSALLEAKERGV